MAAQSDTSYDHVIHTFATMTRLWWHADVRNALVGPLTHDLDTIDVHLIWELGTGEATRPSTLATRLGVGAAAITKRLARLSAHDITTSQPDPTDGRATIITLTQHGENIAEQFHATARATFDSVTATWDDEERHTFINLLERYTTTALNIITNTQTP